MKKRIGITSNPLDNSFGRTNKAQYMFQYFLKVVSTQFRTLNDAKVVSAILILASSSGSDWHCPCCRLTPINIAPHTSNVTYRKESAVILLEVFMSNMVSAVCQVRTFVMCKTNIFSYILYIQVPSSTLRFRPFSLCTPRPDNHSHTSSHRKLFFPWSL